MFVNSEALRQVLLVVIAVKIFLALVMMLIGVRFIRTSRKSSDPKGRYLKIMSGVIFIVFGLALVVAV